MSTPEQPANPPLTRKQMREIRNTGSTPVITADSEAEHPMDEVDGDTFVVSGPAAPAASAPDPVPWQPPAPPTPSAPLARAAEPTVVAPAPVADASVDLAASPLTRRQARQQERIRTASVPVITPEVAAAHAASLSPAPAPAVTRDEPIGLNSGMHDLFGLSTSPAPTAVVESVATTVDDEGEGDSASSASEVESEVVVEPTEDAADDGQKERVVNPMLGAGLLAGEPEPADLPPSFDQLLARSSTGAVSMPNALILSQAPEVAPISAPMSATGEVLITGTLNLPEGLGSTGHALGTADGKEVDATLVDGELPAHSSPTPIAASAAISTVKSAGEVIKPPAPEKGSKLMLTLAITAGALALALVGVLILAFVTGAL